MNVFIGLSIMAFVSLLVYTFITALLGIVVVVIIAGTIVVNTKTKLSVSDTVFMQVNKTDYKVTFPTVMRLSDRDINTIKGVVTRAIKSNNYDMCNRVAYKVKDILKITTEMYPEQFLEKLLEDYYYLATTE